MTVSAVPIVQVKPPMASTPAPAPDLAAAAAAAATTAGSKGNGGPTVPVPTTPTDAPLEPGYPRLHPRAITVIAQSISHLPPISDSAAAFLAPDAEYRIRQIVQDALKFMKHSRRSRLIPDDVNSVLHLRNADPVFGFGPQSRKYIYSRQSSMYSSAIPAPAAAKTSLDKSTQQQQQQQPPSSNPTAAAAATGSGLNTSQPNPTAAVPATQTESSSTDANDTAQGIPLALNATKSAPPDPPSFAQVHGIPNLFFACDKERNLMELIREPLPPLPLEATVVAHWLAIDSTQPSIPQNPARGENEAKRAEKASSGGKGGKGHTSKRRRGNANGSAGGVGSKGGNGRKRRRRNGSGLGPGGAGTHEQLLEVEVKPRIKHNLSRELQLYFDYVRQSIFKNNAECIAACLHSVSNEHGIVQLVPYMSNFVATTVRNHMNDLPLLFSVMRLMNAMMANEAFKVEAYLHQMLPACVSCIVGKRLCSHPSQDHWALRDLAAGVFRRVCDRFERQYVEIKRRFVITLADALNNTNRPLTTHYGAIVGFLALGPLTVTRSLLPKLPQYAKKVKHVLDAPAQTPVRRFEAAKVYCAIACAVSISLTGDTCGGVNFGISPRKRKGPPRLPSLTTINLNAIQQHVPDAPALIPALHKEFGDCVAPLGDRALEEDVANRILELASSQNDSKD